MASPNRRRASLRPDCSHCLDLHRVACLHRWRYVNAGFAVLLCKRETLSRRVAGTRYLVRDRRAFAAWVRALAKAHGGMAVLAERSRHAPSNWSPSERSRVRPWGWPLSRARLYEWANGERREVSARCHAALVVAAAQVDDSAVAARLTARLARLLRPPHAPEIGAAVTIGPAIAPELEEFIERAAESAEPMPARMRVQVEGARRGRAPWPTFYPPVLLSMDEIQRMRDGGWKGCYGVRGDGAVFAVDLSRAATRYLKSRSR